MKTVGDCLTELEISVRRWRRMTVILTLILAAGISAAAGRSGVKEVVQCKRLRIVNDSGDWVVNLDSWMLGGRIDVRNAEGNRTTTIAQSDAGNGMLAVYSSNETNLVFAGADKDSGNGLLAVMSSEGKNLVTAGADPKGDGGLEVTSKDGKVMSLPSE